MLFSIYIFGKLKNSNFYKHRKGRASFEFILTYPTQKVNTFARI